MARKPVLTPCEICEKPTKWDRRATSTVPICSAACSDARRVNLGWIHYCSGGCKRLVRDGYGIGTHVEAWCDTCKNLEMVLATVGEADVAGLARRGYVSEDAFRGRVVDLIRRSHVEDAERLIERFDAMFAKAHEIAAHRCETRTEVLAMHHAEQAANTEEAA